MTYENLHFDAFKMGGLARNINHSCEPNLIVECWWSSNKPRLVFRACRDISIREELTFDYGDQYTDERCLCSARTCRGTIGLVRSIQSPSKPRDESSSEYEPSKHAKHTSISVVRKRRTEAYRILAKMDARLRQSLLNAWMGLLSSEEQGKTRQSKGTRSSYNDYTCGDQHSAKIESRNFTALYNLLSHQRTKLLYIS